jgi:hypothetical protein
MVLPAVAVVVFVYQRCLALITVIVVDISKSIVARLLDDFGVWIGVFVTVVFVEDEDCFTVVDDVVVYL